MANELTMITEEDIRMYTGLCRSVGEEMANKLCPGVRVHLAKLRAGDHSRTYLRRNPEDQERLDGYESRARRERESPH